MTPAPSPGLPASGVGAATRRIRTGIVLPTFRQTADLALDVAARAEEAGVDGVFCYDHVWPLGQPDRPALAPFPVLGQKHSTVFRATQVLAQGEFPVEDLAFPLFPGLGHIAPRLSVHMT